MSLEEIIQGCKNQQSKYQKMLVVRYSSELLTVSRRYVGIGTDAEDILQDAFIKIFEKINQFDENRGYIGNWMRKIVINTALKRLNKASYKNEIYVSEYPEQIIEPEIYQKLNAEGVMSLIEALPEGYRRVFNLYAIEGYSHKEIGSLLGIAEVTSRSNYLRARGLLKKKLCHHKKEMKWVKVG